MNTPKSALVRRVTAVVAATGLVGFLAAAPGFADASSGGSGVHVVNTETVQVYMDSKGGVQSKRVYEQLALTGHGNVDLANPVSTDGLRNLDGFGGIDVQGHDQIVKASVDGTRNYRSVSNFDGDLPVSITPEYYLDGNRVNPGDIVGKSGRLQVQFTVKNLTTKDQQVSYPDGHGGTKTSTTQVPVPMVGSLSTNLPSTFTNIQPGGANTAGDGAGGTTMSYTMTLFPPIGSTTARFGYTANITNGVVPDVSVNVLPVDPMASPTFKSAGDSYKGGAETGTQLVSGAGEIDTNLLKLRDGAATLLAGLLKLRAGADQLHTGLATTAVPGSQKLAKGASDLDNGLGQLNTGARQLDGGLGQLNTGAMQLDGGLGQLNTGARQLDGGSGQLADGARRLSLGANDAYSGGKTLKKGAQDLSTGLSGANDGGKKLEAGAGQLVAGQQGLVSGLQALRDGVAKLPQTVQAQVNSDPQYIALTGALATVIAGIGTLADQPQADPNDNTLLGGLNAMKYGLRYPLGVDCVNAPQTRCGVLDAVQAVKNGIDQQLTSAGGLTTLLTGIATNGCAATPACATYLGQLQTALTGMSTQLGDASTALGEAVTGGNTIYAGINLMRAKISTGANPATCTTAPGTCGVLEGLMAVSGGIPQLVTALSNNVSDTLLASIGDGTAGCDPTKTLLCGANALVSGGNDLSSGINQLADGLAQLNAGGVQLAGGASSLTDGLSQISGGASDLSIGAATLRAGAGKLAAGTATAKTGAGKLAAGTATAKAGAGQLADGTAKAKDGSGQVADGAQQLADGLGSAADGSGQIADGLGTAANGAPRLVDGAQRLSTEGMGQLTKAGESTAQDYGQMYAVLQAGAERAHTHSMAFGAPKGAIGLTAYSFTIKGDDGETGRNWTRGIAALAILALGGGAFALRRRLA